MIAGAAGQVLFMPFPETSLFQSLGTVVGWGILGGLVGYGMSRFVPNLPARNALIGGAIGGAVAGFLFVLLATLVTDFAGRLLGAAILGFVIGSLITMIEPKEAWLEIRFGPKEVVHVSLGETPVSIGSDRSATVRVSGAAPVAVKYWFRNRVIECEDVVASRSIQVRPGDQRQVGNATVTVCAQE
jgi:hypothetical protein